MAIHKTAITQYLHVIIFILLYKVVIHVNVFADAFFMSKWAGVLIILQYRLLNKDSQGVNA